MVGALLTLALGAPAALAESQPVKPTLLQRIRRLIGLNRPIAAGGSRSSPALAVCVITPRTELDTNGLARALVSFPRPTILAAGPLNEVRIDRDGQPIWLQRASSKAAIQGAIGWPIAPIQPGEHLTLLLRPRGASGGDFARIELTSANASEMKANQALVARLGRDANAWLMAVDQALDEGKVSLAWGLLFNPQSPESTSMNDLRKTIKEQACSPPKQKESETRI